MKIVTVFTPKSQPNTKRDDPSHVVSKPNPPLIPVNMTPSLDSSAARSNRPKTMNQKIRVTMKFQTYDY
jgi:hypothetical protein